MSTELSIIVPAYNAEKYLTDCLNSILASTYRDFEILLIDDGSVDGTGEICDQFQRENPQIKVFHTENRGLSMARNLGLENATGQYVGFVDADDLVAPNMFEAMLHQMTHDTQMVCCRYVHCGRGEVSPLKAGGKVSVCTGKEIWNQILCNYYNVNVWTKIYRREVLDQQHVRFKPGYIMEDLYFMTDYLRVCPKAVFMEDQMYFYIKTPESITNTFSRARRVSEKYAALPRGYVYMSDAVMQYEDLFSLVKARAVMSYQRVLRRIDPKNRAFIEEAQSYVRHNNHLLVRYSWGLPCFLSGVILSISYTVWKLLFHK